MFFAFDTNSLQSKGGKYLRNCGVQSKWTSKKNREYHE